MFPAFLVFLGAGIGGVLRHLVNLGCARAFGTSFPYGTLAVNVVGSLAMGLIAGWFVFRSAGAPPALRLFLTTGLLGGFTTFSAFSIDVAFLWERDALGLAALYVAASVGLSILACFAGLAIIRGLA